MTKSRNWDEMSFIDIAVQDGVREAMLSGQAVLVFDRKNGALRWVNGAAATLFGLGGIGGGAGEIAMPQRADIAMRQIRAVLSSLSEEPRIALARLQSGMTSRLIRTHVGRLNLPGIRGAYALVTAPVSDDDLSDDERLTMALTGLESHEAGAAIVDGSGQVLKAGARFAAAPLAPSSVANLAMQTRAEHDRLVKQIVDDPETGRTHAVGVGRLSDLPERYLIVAAALERPVVPEDATTPDDEPGLDEKPALGRPPAGHLADRSAGRDDTIAGQVEQRNATSNLVTEKGAHGHSHSAVIDPGQADAEPPQPEATHTHVQEPKPFTGPDTSSGPVRFVWKTDKDGVFVQVSPEFARAVGPIAAAVEGRSFSAVIDEFALDPSGDLAAALRRRDTWSGKSVLWPVQGSDLQMPVDLAALPDHTRERDFRGYRGFGVARVAETSTDPDARGLALGQQAGPADDAETTVTHTNQVLEDALTDFDSDDLDTPSEPHNLPDEPPALAVAPSHPMRRSTDTVVPLRPHDDDDAITPAPHLSKTEAEAFRKIGQALGRSGAPDDETPGDELTDPEIDDSGDRATELSAADQVPSQTGTSWPDEPMGLPDVDDDGEPTPAELDWAHVDQGEDPADFEDEADLDFADLSDQNEAYSAPLDSDRLGSNGVGGEGLGSNGVGGEGLGGEGLAPETLDGLPLPLLIVRNEQALYANAAFTAMSGDADTDALNARGLDTLFDGQAPLADDDDPDRSVTLLDSDGQLVTARAHLQIVPWNGASALMFAFEPRSGDAPAEPRAAQADTLPDTYAVTAAEVAELHAILDTATDGVILIGPDSTIRSLNGSACALFGYSNEDIQGKSFSFLFAHESQRAALDYLHGLANNGVASVLNEGREVLGRERNGGFLPLFMTVGRLAVSDGYCAVLRDITPWKQTEQALEDAKREAEQASNTKSEFLAKISHEIRTPLNAIIGFSELMSEERFGPIGNARYKDYLADINRSGRHVLDLVNDLLDISKIEAGKQDLEFESVALNDAIGEAIAMIQPQANRNQIIVRSSLEGAVPPVVADLRSIKQIVLNLLSNAVRFTHAGGQVIVSTSYAADGSVLLRIRDSGIGMTEKELESALKPFQQVTAIGHQRGDGTGLGLPLTKALVEANRADFDISSEPGRGTRVDIVFPSTRVLAS